MTVYEVLQAAQPLVYGLLAALTVVLWLRSRDAPSAWLAGTFTVLGAVLLLAQLVPDRPAGPDRVIQHAVVVGVILFPYLLHRFSASMLRARRWIELVGGVLTAVTVALALALPEYPEPGEPRTGWFVVLVTLLLVQWTFLLASTAVRFWRAGHDQPTVARRRMRTLSGAAVLLALALLIAGAARPTDEPGPPQAATQLLSILSAPLFFLGFAPPAGVRQAWRRPEEVELDRVDLALLGDLSEHEAAELLVPAVARLVGGGVMLVLDDGKTVVAEGIEAEDRVALLDDERETMHADPNLITVSMRAGRLVIKGSSCTPFFGRDEVALARRLAARADLALDRARSIHLIRQQAQLLDLAADAIFMRTPNGTIRYWNEGAERLYGWTSAEALGRISFDLLNTQLPSDVDEINRQLFDEGRWEGTLSQTRKDGSTVVVSSRWSLQRDPEPLVLQINTDITERVREEELRERFIANAAHELRTPLTSLLGFAQVLGMPNRTEEQSAMAQSAINRSAQRLRALVDNLLDLTRLQSEPTAETSEEIAVESLLRTVVDAVAIPDDASVTVEVTRGLRVRTVPVLLERVVTNLLTNAFRYGGPEVRLQARPGDGLVVLAVEDNGRGVEADVRDRLFDPFARGATSTAVGGSGLGLAIVRTAVEQLGGTIRYEDVVPHGARFVLELPMADGAS